MKGSAWDGKGLPPTGLAVEWHSDSNTGWQKVVVIAYNEDSAWIQPEGKPSIIVGNPANFRPILDVEQQLRADYERWWEETQGNRLYCESTWRGWKAQFYRKTEVKQ